MDYQKLLQKKEKLEREKQNILPTLYAKTEKAFQIEFTHHSTAIEGNTLTLLETKLLLDDQISVGNKQLREVYEVLNHHKATLFTQRCVKEGRPLDEEITKEIHAIINENILVGGVYRNQPVRITGASHKPPAGQEMYRQIKYFFEDLENYTQRNAVEQGAWTHAEFVRIHPFVDGNGRTARQILNYQLMSAGFPAVSISVKDRLDYYQCLDLYATTGDLQPFAEMVATLVEQRLDDFLELIPKIDGE